MTPGAAAGRVIALSGGVGGAKLALGLAQELDAEQLLIVANTGDDFEHLGLTICPDLDSVMYALAGINDETRGWGLAGESWQALGALAQLGGETWFQLGDKDLATHILRSDLLRQGIPLADVTASLCKALNINAGLVPMTDASVRTMVATATGELAFQHYFVRDQCAPAVSGFRFDGIGAALPNPDLLAWLEADDLAAVVICPSNPFVSVDPILSLPGVRAAITDCSAPVIAVSPIVGGKAIKGPAAKMLTELGFEVTAGAVADWYGDLLDGYVLDHHDADLAASLRSDRRQLLVTDTVMTDRISKRALARAVLDFARHIA